MQLLRARTHLFGVQNLFYDTSRLVRISLLISAHKIKFHLAPFFLGKTDQLR